MGRFFLAHKWSQANKWFLLGLVSLMISTFLVLIILVATKVIGWDWVIGWVVAFFCSIAALFLIYYAYQVLIKTENYYTYLFLFVSRLGLYFVPFILAVFVLGNNSVFGVLIGFSPIILLPLFQGGYHIFTTNQTTGTGKLKDPEGGA